VSGTPCPRCGCHLVKNFKCGCGEVHSDYCVNCGRFTTLGPTEAIELGPYDARCGSGLIAHEHSDEEKAERLEKAFKKARRAS